MTDDDDEPIDTPVYNTAVVATQLLTVADALALQFGAETVRSALFVAFAEFTARDLGEIGMREELRGRVERLLEDPMIAAAVKWLH